MAKIRLILQDPGHPIGWVLLAAKSLSMAPLINRVRQIPARLPLRVVLSVPFIIQILASTGTVGYLSYRNGQRAVSDLANQLMLQAGERVSDYLNTYLSVPEQLNQTNLDIIEAGLLNVYDFQSAGTLFRKQFDDYNVSYISYGLKNGDFIGAGYFEESAKVVIEEVSTKTQNKLHVYATNSLGNRIELIDVSEYEFLDEDWYKATLEKGSTTWSEVYESEGWPGLLWIANNTPIRDQENQIIGVLSVDFLLSEISLFIKDINISENSRVFIFESDGLLIASSDQESPTVVEIDQPGKIRRRSVFESQDLLLQSAATYLKQHLKDFSSLKDAQKLTWRYNGRRQFILVQPWYDKDGLDWLVVTIVPENDFMAQINKNTRTTVLLSILTLIVATQVGLWTARWVTNPLRQLSRAAKNIEAGDLSQSIELNRQDELGALAQSFNHMAVQLDSSFRELQILNATLEDQVQARTLELSQALEQLRATQADLIESEKLAALGQLIAGIAHEVNTPLGAIQASIGNIDYSLKQSLSQIPEIFQILPAERLREFFRLVDMATQPKPLLSSREERQLRRQLTQTLNQQGIAHASELAVTLSKMGISEGVDSLLDLLKHPDILAVLESAYSLSSIQTNSQNIQQAVERATKIVFALKAYVRQDQTGQKVLASITDGLDTVLTLYHNQIKQGIDVIKHYAELPALLCYPDELVQVWANLIMNAIQAMNYKGTLTIAATTKNKHVCVEVSDTGAGIPAENLDKIFTPFFTTKAMGEGSGLGLHIVRQIVEKHQGSIEVSSQPGRTVFIVTIPLLEE
jgi:signal transduction histidine kinase